MRRFWLGCAAAGVLAMGGDYLVWRWAVLRLAGQCADWAVPRPDGISLRGAAAVIPGGWPVVARVTIPEAVLSAAGRTLWQGQALDVEASPWRPLHMTLRPRGPQAVLPGEPWGAVMETVSASVDIPMRITWQGWWPAGLRGEAAASGEAADIRIVAAGLRLKPGAVSHAAPGELQSALPGLGIVSAESMNARLRLDHAFSLQAQVAGVMLPADRPWPFGPAVAHAGFTARVEPAFSPRPDMRAQAQEWRAAQGVFRVLDADIQWGALDARLAGQGTLDDALLPVAEGVATIAGPDKVLISLRDHGWIRPGVWTAAKGLLGLFVQVTDAAANTKTIGNEGRSEGLSDRPDHVSISLKLAENTVMIGQVPVLKVPPPPWADARR